MWRVPAAEPARRRRRVAQERSGRWRPRRCGVGWGIDAPDHIRSRRTNTASGRPWGRARPPLVVVGSRARFGTSDPGRGLTPSSVRMRLLRSWGRGPSRRCDQGPRGCSVGSARAVGEPGAGRAALVPRPARSCSPRWPAAEPERGRAHFGRDPERSPALSLGQSAREARTAAGSSWRSGRFRPPPGGWRRGAVVPPQKGDHRRVG